MLNSISTARLIQIIFSITVLLSGCAPNSKKEVRSTVQPGTTGTSCAELGGKVDEPTKECRCENGRVAPSSGCSGDITVDAVVACFNGGGQWESGAKKCQCPEDSNWDGKSCSNGESIDKEEAVSLLKSTCAKAGGQWWDSDEYCACPDKKVLSGNTCVRAEGVITKELCQGSINRGAWVGDKCVCDEGKVFSPGRGGCVVKPPMSDKVHKSICIGSLNNGKWDAGNSRCECPQGQKELVWHNEYCQDKAGVPPKDLCSGDFNNGVWDLQKATCKCGLGSIWVNKTCESLQTAEPKATCESDFNKGKWDEARRTCLCPGGLGWSESVKTCSDTSVGSWQLLCTQSGGVPGLEVGICQCGRQYEKKILMPQKFEYCMLSQSPPPTTGTNPPPGGANTEGSVPDWLKLLLGIVK